MTVRTQRGHLKFGDVPVKGKREHYDPDKGDTKNSIKKTAKVASGPDKIKQQDFNTILLWLTLVPGDYSSHVAAGWLGIEWDNKAKKRILVSIGAHWTTVGGNGYTHWVDLRGRAHHFTKNQMSRKHGITIQNFVDDHGGTLKALHMLRRPNGDHPLLWVEAIRIAAPLGVVLDPETKSQGYKDVKGAETIVGPCRRNDYPCWPMTLISMKFAMQKRQAFHVLGVVLSIIFGEGVRGVARRVALGKRLTRNWPNKPVNFW